MRRDFVWIFIVASVEQPIIGADFMYHHKIDLSLHEGTITDSTTGLSIKAEQSYGPLISMPTPLDENLKSLLKKYPSLTAHFETLPPPTHGHTHKIPTVGEAPFVRPRKLDPSM